MRIIHIINSLHTGGAEKLLLETIPLYNKKGIKTDVLLLNGSDSPFLKQLEEQKCCTIFSLGKGSVYNPFLIFKIIPFLKKYDIVHVHLFPAQYWVVLAKILSFSNVKLLFTEHSTTNTRLENKFFKRIDKFSYRHFTKIVCITKEVFLILKEHTGMPTNRFEIILNGVQVDNFKDAVKIRKTTINSAIDKEDKLIIMVAGFRLGKGHTTLIKTMKLLPNDTKLLLVGDGVQKNECEKLVEDLKLEKKVLFLGVRLDVNRLLKTADIVVLASDYEGLSLSSIEGMASGNPFVASNVPGLREVVKGAGVLFENRNEVDLANKIQELLDDNLFYKEVSEKCKERAAQYDISIMVEKHLNLYKNI